MGFFLFFSVCSGFLVLGEHADSFLLFCFSFLLLNLKNVKKLNSKLQAAVSAGIEHVYF